MFEPPRCPNERCPKFTDPTPGFYSPNGHYVARVHRDPIPRFRCKSCRRGFSTQTFRISCHDRRPHLNRQVVEMAASGVWIREIARRLKIRRKNLEAKLRKLSRHVGALDTNLVDRGRLVRAGMAPPDLLELQFDEFESYETNRRTRPLTIATAIESSTRFLIAAVVAPIRPKGKMNAARRAEIARDEALMGRRPHRSVAACKLALRRAASYAATAQTIELRTDEKPTYPAIAEEAFRRFRLVHLTTPGSAPRGVGTPLFPINHMEAKARRHLSRLQRQSMYASKRRKYLKQHLRFHIGIWNWAKQRFWERNDRTPAELSGFAVRALEISELVKWRQDWRQRSPCPFGNGTRSVGQPPRVAG